VPPVAEREVEETPFHIGKGVGEMSGPREWLVIESTRGRGVFATEEHRNARNYIPRDVAEELLGRDLGGTVFFTSDESAKMKAHPDWRDDEPPATLKGPDHA
jgi:hypothetical protein